MKVFLIVTLSVWILQILGIIVCVITDYFEDEGEENFITTKRQLLIALIPYFWVWLLGGFFIKWFNNLK